MIDDEAPERYAGGRVGVGGWLLLPVAGLVLALLRGLSAVLDFGGLEGVNQHLGDRQRAFLVAEIVGNTPVYFLLPLVLLILLSRKKRSFPGFYVFWAVLVLVFQLADTFIGNALFLDVSASGLAGLLDPATSGPLAGAAILVVVWVSYMLMLRRVRNTFVN